jgi:hypothetical protein
VRDMRFLAQLTKSRLVPGGLFRLRNKTSVPGCLNCKPSASPPQCSCLGSGQLKGRSDAGEYLEGGGSVTGLR